uniref:Uncharacterized protein n=1 Tax=Oryza sativa subsp. japonica TaxID=39947 RepID=Q6ERY9_ORYSJ|nr:hypothetical protein [Oryza sativa Japonica Group]
MEQQAQLVGSVMATGSSWARECRPMWRGHGPRAIVDTCFSESRQFDWSLLGGLTGGEKAEEGGSGPTGRTTPVRPATRLRSVRCAQVGQTGYADDFIKLMFQPSITSLLIIDLANDPDRIQCVGCYERRSSRAIRQDHIRSGQRLMHHAIITEPIDQPPIVATNTASALHRTTTATVHRHRGC